MSARESFITHLSMTGLFLPVIIQLDKKNRMQLSHETAGSSTDRQKLLDRGLAFATNCFRLLCRVESSRVGSGRAPEISTQHLTELDEQAEPGTWKCFQFSLAFESLVAWHAEYCQKGRAASIERKAVEIFSAHLARHLISVIIMPKLKWIRLERRRHGVLVPEALCARPPNTLVLQPRKPWNK